MFIKFNSQLNVYCKMVTNFCYGRNIILIQPDGFPADGVEMVAQLLPSPFIIHTNPSSFPSILASWPC